MIFINKISFVFSWIALSILNPAHLGASSLNSGSACDIVGSNSGTFLWTANGNAQIRRSEPVQQPNSSIKLYAARNEYEPFQATITACGDDAIISNITVSNLVSGLDTISSEQIIIYREHFLEITEPSPFSPGGTGFYADALVPLNDPKTGERLTSGSYTALPNTVSNGFNQPFWIDIYVPVETTPGRYVGTLTFEMENSEPLFIDIDLTVWGFSLPRKPSLPASFGIDGRLITSEYGYGYDSNREKFFPLIRDFYSLMIDHRIAPFYPLDALPAVDFSTGNIDFDLITYDGLGTTSAENLDYYLNTAQVGVLRMPVYLSWPFSSPLDQDRAKTKHYLKEWYRYLESKNYPNDFYIYTVDEPRDAAAYENIRQWGALVNEVEAELNSSYQPKYFITEQPESRNAEWGNLIGAIDIWAPCCDYHWVDFDLNAEDSQLRARQEAVEEVWWYNALVQPSANWYQTFGVPEKMTDNYTPVWLMDFPSMNFRIPMWLARKYGVSGIEYWQTLRWSAVDDVWTDPSTFKGSQPLVGSNSYNGDGSFIYPGTLETVGFEGPISSIRLKWLREGMEDYEYLVLLDAQPGRSSETYINSVARSMIDWDLESSAMYEARIGLGNELDDLLGEKPNQTYLPFIETPSGRNQDLKRTPDSLLIK